MALSARSMSLMLVLWLSFAPAETLAQRLTASQTIASPLATNHAVTVNFTPGPDTGAFEFSLDYGGYSALVSTRTSQISGSIANGSLQCAVPSSQGYLKCVALATSHGVDLGAGTVTILFDIGSMTGVIPLTLGFYAVDQDGDYENGEDVDGEIVVSGAPTALTFIEAGGSHTCGLISGGGAVCWGNGYNGQLGNSIATASSSAVRVTGLSSGVSAISAGGSHTCSLASGGMKCWGWNAYGALGDGTTTDRWVPVNVTGLASGVSAISAGSYHTCAVVAGAAKCWGSNLNGELGDNSTTSRPTPTGVNGLTSGITAVAAGTFHSCALTSAAGVKCWGYGGYGALGDSTFSNRLIPANVTGLASGVGAIAVGEFHSCALTTTGGVKCWGLNGKGEVGDNSFSTRSSPVNVSGLTSGVTAITTGRQHSCALTSAGAVLCWGSNQYGQLGDNSTTDRLLPVAVSGLGSGVVAISAGNYHTCARTSAGASKCWGSNSFGGLGNNGYAQSLVPVDVSGLSVGQVSISIANVSVVEGNSGTKLATFVANLSAPSSNPVTFTVKTSGGTATPDLDYVPQYLVGQVIAPGQTQYSFVVVTNSDTGIEPDETFNVTLSSVSGAIVADGKAVGTILDDDDISCRFLDNGETGPGLWLATGSGAGSNFTLDTASANSPTHSWFVPDPALVSDRQLVLATPVLLAANTSPVLEFAHRYAVENTFDGGVLEYSTNGGGTWQDILAGSADGVPANAARILTGGYNAAISTGQSNPIGGRQAWTGSTAGFIATRVDLTDFAGRSILLRFRFGSNSSQSGTGWWIDDIRVAVNSGCIGPSLSIADVTVSEGNSGTSTATFTVSLGQATSVPVTFDIATGDGTAFAGNDYVALALANQTIAAGQTGKTFAVTINGDGIVEQNETFTVALANVAGAAVTRGVATGTINNDDTPLLSISDISLQESSSGTRTFNFVVSLSQPTFVPVTFNLVSANGTALAGSDFVAFNYPSAVINPGNTSASYFNVVVNGDTTMEPDETFTVNVGNVVGATVADGIGTGTIIDDDTPGLSISDISIAEGNNGGSIATFTVSLALDRPTTDPVSFNLATADGTATAGGDYLSLNLVGQTIAAGQSSKTFNVSVTGDTTVEPDETFTIVASNVTGAKIVKGSATGTIANDDTASLSIADVSIAEGNSGTKVATFTVTQSLPSSTALTFDVATANGTATAGSDYVALAMVGQSIPAGQTSKTVAVTINGDITVESDESFTVSLGNIGSLRAGAVDVAAGWHGCALLSSGALQCWGPNSSGQVGTGATGNSVLAPTTVIAGGVAQVSAGSVHTCAVLTSGALQCWGNNGSGQVGNGSSGNVIPAPVTVIANGVAKVSAGESHTCVLLVSGAVQCWGNNALGQVGNSSVGGDVLARVTVIAAGATQLTAGRYHNCAVVTGALQCWGHNGNGQIGNGGSGASVLSPVTVIASGAIQATAGYFHTCAVLDSGALKCWGSNSSGRLGNGSSVENDVLTPLTILANGVQQASAGPDRSCAVLASGAVQCWGYNINGQVGTGSSGAPVLAPTTVIASGASRIAVGHDHACAVVVPDSLKCWGSNWSGQVGNGTTVNVLTPTTTIVGGYTVAKASATGTITNDDSASLSIADVSVVEGNIGSSQMTFTVSLSQASSTAVTFDIATANATATAGSDYMALSLANQSIAAGQTSKSFAVTINGDTSIESSETFAVNLGNASGATISDGVAVGTILDDDLPALSVADVTVTEGNSGTSTATVTVSLSQTALAPVGFNIGTGAGSATAGSDFIALAESGRSIPAGQSSATFVVTINGDTAVEADESFAVNVSNVSGATVADSNAVVTIANDDSLQLSIADATTAEGNSGASAMTFTVSLNGTAPLGGVSFDIATRGVRGGGNAAQAGVDYSIATQAGRSIASGASTATFVVKVFGDTRFEPDEMFSVELGNASGAGLADGSATGTISNDDARSLAIADVQGAGGVSPLLGQQVRVQGVVTARRRGGVFLQTADGQDDADPATSEAVYVSTEALTNGDFRVGHHLEVFGTVFEASVGKGLRERSRTQIAAIDIRVLDIGNPLPKPVVIDGAVVNHRQSIDGLERFEGMRVQTPRLTVVAPVGGVIDETNASVVADGVFHVVMDGSARPFREPGARAQDGASSRAGPVFDGNPERLRVDSQGQLDAQAIAVDGGHRITSLTGVIDHDRGAYVLLPDPGKPPVLSAGATTRAASVMAAGQTTVAEFVLGRFFDDRNDPARSEPLLSERAYALRLAKTANAVCSYLRRPDILAVFEIENRETLSDLAAAINTNAGNVLFPGACAGHPAYRAHMAEGTDADGLSSGLLVNAAEIRPGVPRVQVVSQETLSTASRFANRDGSSIALHDTPPLLLRVRVNDSDGGAMAFSVLAAGFTPAAHAAVEHDEAAGAQGWPTRGEQQRARRLAQAQDLKAVLERRQRVDPAERMVLLGAFDALDFDDGREDPLSILSTRGRTGLEGMPSSGATHTLSSMFETLPAGERYTMVEDGDAQAREHVLVNRALRDSGLKLKLEAVRLNADFGADNFGDFDVPVRASARDPLLLRIGRP